MDFGRGAINGGKTDRKAGMELVGDPNQNSPSLGRKAHIEILSFFFPCGFTVLSTVQGTRLVLSASSSGRRGEDPTSPTTWNVSKPENGI